MFTNQVCSDGFSIVFQFARPKKPQAVELELQDFTSEEISKYYRVCAIDPGVRHLFTASYGAGGAHHEVRRCSSKEYYTMTGSLRRGKQLLSSKKRLGIDTIETNYPTGKTSNIERYRYHVDYFFSHREVLFSFYGLEDAERRFRDYQGRQRAQEEIANMLINGGRKYDRRKRKHRSKNRKKRKHNRECCARYKKKNTGRYDDHTEYIAIETVVT